MKSDSKPRNSYGIEIHGSPLDGQTMNVISFGLLENLQTILCYDYEDGKKWHDLTCVMELIFRNQEYMENEPEIEDYTKRVRFLYDHPVRLLYDFAKLTEKPLDSMIAVRMDLTAGWFQHDNKDSGIGIRFEDFEIFSCTIKHKKRFHPKNPDMPYD